MLHDKDLVSIQEVRTKVAKAYAASLKYRSYSQEQVDAIVEAMAAAGRANAKRLAQMAVEETGYGNAPDKTVKNLLGADLLARSLRGMRTIGVLRELRDERMTEIAVPLGVVAAILPVTNPTSTVIYKTLISLKAGNAVVIAPHPHAYKCTCATADVLYQAALQAGAPEDIIQCVGASTIEGTSALMKHERTAVILATGGHGIVRAAYSSGTPALGVGPGNTPVLIDRSADIPEAVAKTVIGKMFDYGTVCTSEQAIVAEESLREQIVAELKARKAFFCNEAQQQAMARVLVTPSFTINSKCVGQSPVKIAQMAGFEVPADTTVIMVELKGVGREHPLSMEKLSPVLALYFRPDWAACLDACEALMRFGGLGHTCVIYATDDARIREFGMRMPAMRVVVNTPAPQGSTGITTNLPPAMTLGCGAMAGNSTGDNVGPMHLLNVKRIAHAVRKPEEAFTAPAEDEPAQAGPVARHAVAAAVDRFMASRGMGGAAATPAPVAPRVTAAAPANVAAQVVDRFLSQRSTAPAEPAPAALSCKPGGA
ncbi:MAG TPA: aldehyde dehydrogenase family protein [Bryobacteraceae bacterium]|nr:aldehyde dehydrogenase family protein [Bryobacteraceae bacterium]